MKYINISDLELRKLEEEYLKKINRYHIERELFSVIGRNELQAFISNKIKEEKYHKNNLVKYMKKLINKPGYKSFNELQNELYILNHDEGN